MLKYALKNWQTTSAGITMIIGSVAHLVFAVQSGTGTETVWTVSLTAIVAGLGLIFAGDASASEANHDETKSMISEVDAKIQENTATLQTKQGK